MNSEKFQLLHLQNSNSIKKSFFFHAKIEYIYFKTNLKLKIYSGNLQIYILRDTEEKLITKSLKKNGLFLNHFPR